MVDLARTARRVAYWRAVSLRLWDANPQEREFKIGTPETHPRMYGRADLRARVLVFLEDSRVHLRNHATVARAPRTTA
jgi:hypothetical protein